MTNHFSGSSLFYVFETITLQEFKSLERKQSSAVEKKFEFGLNMLLEKMLIVMYTNRTQ